MELINYIRNLWSETIAPTIKSSWDRSRQNTEDIIRSIQNKETPTDISINNPEDINSSIIDAQKETTQAVKDIPSVEIPEIDLNTVESKLEAIKSAVEKKEMSVNVGKTIVDTKGVIKAIERLQKSIPESKEQTDYTLMLDEMMKLMERPKDHSEIKKLQELVKPLSKTEDIAILAQYLQALIEKEYPVLDLPRDEDGIPLFTPTKVGGGGSGGLTKIETDALVGLSENAATSENQTNGDQKTQIVDGDGDVADVIATNGSKGLVTLSPGHLSTVNSTSTPLNSDTTFTGDWEDITNFGIIVITVKASHASTTDGLEVEFSSDGTNVDSSDCFTIPATTGKTFSFQAATRYFRVKYTNSDTNQTYLRLQTILKPYYVKPSSHRITDSIIGEDDAELVKAVLTGIDQDDDFVNIESTYAKSLKTSIYDGETGRRAEVEPLGALKSIIPVRLVGTTFSNGTKDPNFWTETVTGTGSVAQNGEITLSTGTTANSGAKYETVRKARKITGTTNQFRAVARNVETPAADCIRRIGAYDDDNGFFFQFNGTTFQVGSRKDGTDTLVSNGSFNGNAGATIDFGGGTDFTRIIIDYTALSAKFFVDGKLIHTIMPTTASLTETLNLPAAAEIINENDNTTNNSYEILFATILRLGELVTNPIYKYINTNTTTVCKYNAGTLQRLVINDNVGDITIYDGTSTAGDLISELDTSQGAEPAYTVEYNTPFNDGLTIVTSGGVEVTVIYE